MMARLAWAALRARKGIFVGTFIAATLAIAIIASSGLLMESALRGHSDASRFAGADAVITADRNVTIQFEKGAKHKLKSKSKTLKEGAPALPADLAEQIGKISGVKDAIPDWSFYAQPIDLAGKPVLGRYGSTTLGHGWSSAILTPFALLEGHAPSPGEVVLDEDLADKAGAALNGEIRITTSQGVEVFHLSGIVAPQKPAGQLDQGSLFFSTEDVARLASPTPSAIGVLAEPGADRAALAEALRNNSGGAEIYMGRARGKAESPMGQTSYLGAVSLLGITGAVTVFAAIFVIAGTVSFSVRQRLRELALLRTIGATPNQLRKMLGQETLILTLMASVVGSPVGWWLSLFLKERLVGLGVIPAQFELRFSLLPFAAALVAGLLVTQAAAWLAARRSSQIAPTQALRETVDDKHALSPIKLALGLIFIAGGLAVLLFGPLGGGDGTGIGMGFIACMLFLIGATLLGPLLVKTIGGLIGLLIRKAGGVTGDLAASNTSIRADRIAGIALPLALLVALNGTMLLSSKLFDDISADQRKARLATDYEITAQGTPGLPLSMISDIRALPGVEAVTATIPVSVMIREGGKLRTYQGQGLASEGGSSPTIELGVQSGELNVLADDAVAVSAELAQSQRWGLGDKIEMWLSDGVKAKLRIVAVYGLSRGLGDMLLPGKLAEAHGRNGMAGAMYVQSALGSVGALTSEALAGLRQQWPMVGVINQEESALKSSSAVSSQQAAFDLLVGITILFTAIAVFNTFAIATSTRASEFADLRLAGTTFGQIRRMLRWESLVITILGVLIGCVIMHVILGILGLAQDGEWHWTIDVRTYISLLAGAVLLGLLANILPARQTIQRLRKGLS